MQGRREQCPTQLSRFTQEQATSLAVCSGLTLAQQAMHTLWQLSEAPQWLAAMKINPARRSYMMQGDMKEEAEKRNLLHLTPFPGLTLWPSHTHQSHHVFIWHHGQSYPATPSCHGRLRSVKTTKPTHKYVVWWHKRWCNWIRFHTFLLASLLLQAHVCRCHGDDKNRAVFSVYDHLPRTSLQTGRAQRAHRHSLPMYNIGVSHCHPSHHTRVSLAARSLRPQWGSRAEAALHSWAQNFRIGLSGVFRLL